MLTVSYENRNEIDMYVEYFDYDIMEMVEFEQHEEHNENMIDSSDDNYSSDDCQEIDYVDFQTEGDDNVVIKKISTQDPFLNKLCHSRILFRCNGECRMLDINETPEIDRDDNQIDFVYKVKRRNMVEGRCASNNGYKDRLMPNKDRTSGSKGKQVKKVVKNKKVKKVTKKKVVTDSREGWSRPPEQTSGAELRSRTFEQTSDPDNPNETSNAGMVGLRLRPWDELTVLCLTFSWGKKELQQPLKWSKLNHTLTLNWGAEGSTFEGTVAKPDNSYVRSPFAKPTQICFNIGTIRMEEERIGIGAQKGPSIPDPLAQTNTCLTVIKEKIEASRMLTGEHDQHDKIGENPKKLTCNESKREELEDPQYEKQTCEKSLISGIREKELIGNFYMKIPEQKFRSSYGSMPLKGVRKRSSGIPLEIKKNRSKTHSMLKY
ncbi:hypothetical protein Tco_0072606 [Tanacetum coccineum]